MAERAAPDAAVVTRARAALLGAVVGNQLGVTTEGLGTPEAIRARFPDGVWDPAPPPAGSPYDADSALSLLLAESLAERGDFDAGDVAARWLRWMKLDGRGLGRRTRRVLYLVERGAEPFDAARRALDSGQKTNAGNGAVTRGLPVALRFHDDPARLVRVATQQAALTHADERCLWASAAVALAARELLHGNHYFVDEVLHRLADRAPRVLLDAIRRSVRESQEDLPIAVPEEHGYVVHCVEIAFWFATQGRTFEDALVYLVQAGGDTDGNATLAGGLLGARDGESAIPQRWKDAVTGAAGIVTLADRLIGAA